jgi:uncharacterized protein (DUF1330 family)
VSDHVNPTDDQLREVVAGGGEGDGPVVMLNLNRYRDRDAYLRYGEVALRAIDAVGGRVLWAAPVEHTVIGCDHDRYDEVIAVWYPSRAAFLGLMEFPGYLEATGHRDAGVEQAALIAVDGQAM